MVYTKEDLIPILRQLMLSENLGDVHDAIIRFTDLLQMERFEGDFLDGWRRKDYIAVGIYDVYDEDDETY